MADIRINALTTTATASASDDYIAIDGSANGTRKLSAYSPTFGGNLTVSGTDIRVNNTTGYFYVDSGSSLTGMILSRTGNVLELATANVVRLTISSAGNTTLGGNLTVSGTGNSSIGGTLLVNGASPSGNGAIQLATHTTSAGGIGFGADTALYRQQTSQLALDCTGGVSMVQFRTSGTYNGRVGYDGSNVELRSVSGSVVLISNNTTALTLDASQNATFAGTLTVNGAGTSTVKRTNAGQTTFLTLQNQNQTGNDTVDIDFSSYSGTATTTGRFSNVRTNRSTAGDSDFVLSLRSGGSLGEKLRVTDQGNATFSGAIAIGNTVAAAAGVASTHKVTISIGGSTYYLLATNV
jgi:hypothetical protein